MDSHYLPVNGIRLHVVQEGPENGPVVLLLHGYPEFSLGWRHQIPALSAAGFRVWAPDLRGYNLSDKPKAVRAYTIDELIKDVLGLIEATGRERVHVVGHDWGGALAWQLASRHPERIERLVVLNAPKAEVMRRALREDRAQRRRSWYFLYYQIPWLPEFLSRLDNWRRLSRALRESALPGTFTDADLDLYREAWSRPGAMSAMINWYRAYVRYSRGEPPRVIIKPPTLLIWGAGDRFLGRALAQPSIDSCEDGRLVHVEEATHWVHLERPEFVNEQLLGFLSES